MTCRFRNISDKESAFVIQVKPGRTKERLIISEDGSLVVHVCSKAHKGQANKSVILFLSRVFDCPKRDIEISRGDLSTHKEIRIKNLTSNALSDRLAAFMMKHEDCKR